MVIASNTNNPETTKKPVRHKVITSKVSPEIKEKIRKASQIMFERNQKAYKDLEKR